MDGIWFIKYKVLSQLIFAISKEINSFFLFSLTLTASAYNLADLRFHLIILLAAPHNINIDNIKIADKAVLILKIIFEHTLLISTL